MIKPPPQTNDPTLIFQFPIYLKPLAPRQANISGNDRPLIFQIYRELKDEGNIYTWNLKHLFFNRCFNWMTPNHYMKNGWKSPFPSIKKWLSSWWFQPIWKICSSNCESSPSRGENKKYLKPPPRKWLFRVLGNSLLCILENLPTHHPTHPSPSPPQVVRWVVPVKLPKPDTPPENQSLDLGCGQQWQKNVIYRDSRT